MSQQYQHLITVTPELNTVEFPRFSNLAVSNTKHRYTPTTLHVVTQYEYHHGILKTITGDSESQVEI
jgi:hypothetical protein